MPLAPSVAAVLQGLRMYLPETRPTLVAVSGGRDSVVLLHLMVTAGLRRVVVCHLNHGLRGRESGQDAAWVRRLAKQYGLPCEVERVDVAALARTSRQSLELAGRDARHQFFGQVALRLGAAKIFLAHHADDQAETILANLCRGTGLRGLGGMRPEHQLAGGLWLVRPLLGVRRTEIAEYATVHDLGYREDSSNRSLDHRRNRLRHGVLPLLNQIFDRDVAPIVARAGLQAARDDECLTEWVKDFKEGTDLAINAELLSLHPALLSRVLSRWLKVRLALPGIDFEVVESAVAMLRPGGPAKINLPGGRHLRRRAKKLFVTPE